MFDMDKLPQENNNVSLETKLETSRFQLSSESLELIKKARIQLEKLKQTEPAVLGFGFFGSRIIKNENKESDLDCIIFYDGSKYDKDTEDKLVWNDEKFEFEAKTIKHEKTIRHNQDLIYGKLKSRLYDIKTNETHWIPYQVANTVDLSHNGIIENIEHFKEFIELNKFKSGEYGSEKGLSNDIWGTVAPFFLSVGDGVYKARLNLLSELERRSDGEDIWKQIIGCLSWIERDAETKKRYSLSKYKFYPQTIEDAKKFFKVI